MDEKLELFRFVAYLPESAVEYKVLALGLKDAYTAGMRELEARHAGKEARKIEVTRYATRMAGDGGGWRDIRGRGLRRPISPNCPPVPPFNPCTD